MLYRGEVCEIETLLLRCRVIGRTVETALITLPAQAARTRGARALEGWFLPTKKNLPVRDFFATHGFQPKLEQEDGVLRTLDFQQTALTVPEWIDCRTLVSA